MSAATAHTESKSTAWTISKRVFKFGKKTGSRFGADECTSMAASLAFYTIFSLPSLLLVVIAIVGFVFDADTAKTGVQREAGQFLGPQAKEQVGEVVEKAKRPQGRTLATIFGIATLVFGATGALAQLQESLNKVWRVEPDPTIGGVKQFAMKRVMSLAMLLVIAFLLLITLVISAFLTAAGEFVGEWVGSQASTGFVWFVHLLTSVLVIAVLFAAIFKVLPDAEVAWLDAGVGGLFTALLFLVGKSLFGLYLGNSDYGSAYGQAGSLMLTIMWIYYSALVLLLGAEFTWVWSNRYGTDSRPSNGAVHVEKVKMDVRTEDDAERVAEMRDSSSVDCEEDAEEESTALSRN